jgi:KaiC/GvpD/RAD55 family RecA-like ATPase
MLWGVHENVDLYCFGFDIDPNAQPIDHADAVESLRQLVLSALRDQQAQYSDVNSVAHGLSWRPVSQRWETVKNALTRYGRALVITVAVEVTVPMAQPQEATITSYQLSQTLTQGPS